MTTDPSSLDDASSQLLQGLNATAKPNSLCGSNVCIIQPDRTSKTFNPSLSPQYANYLFSLTVVRLTEALSSYENISLSPFQQSNILMYPPLSLVIRQL
ncbi:unnamed protein product [Paramecium primaurelia]|uniref:Uncharacterized protein n=1 Tax=Paramecium primaurelia TaxID=5886 RepID=A0A8S1QC04_PARPR|nr:unnamed protein product [Paramecium primaurelia]